MSARRYRWRCPHCPHGYGTAASPEEAKADGIAHYDAAHRADHDRERAAERAVSS